MEGIYYINGQARIGSDDFTTLADVDSAVQVLQKQEQKEFYGSSPTPKRTHTLKHPCTIKFQKCPFNNDQLEYLAGYTSAVSTLDDGTTVSAKYSLTSEATQRPEVALLVAGSDDLTGKKVEIKSAKCKLMTDIDFTLAVQDFSMMELEFLCLQPTDDVTDDYVSINFES